MNPGAGYTIIAAALGAAFRLGGLAPGQPLLEQAPPGLASPEQALPGQATDPVIAAVRDLPTGAQIVEIDGRPSLVAKESVALREELDPAEASAGAAAVATLEARADAAVFLAAQVAASTEVQTREARKTRGSDASASLVTRLVEHVRISATASLPAGRLVSLTCDGKRVEAVLAWDDRCTATLPSATRDSLRGRAEELVASPLPLAIDLRSGSTASGEPGLWLEVVTCHGGLPATCTLGASADGSGPGCRCASCLSKVLDERAGAVLLGWLRGGDVEVARTLTTYSTYIEEQAAHGAAAARFMAGEDFHTTTSQRAAGVVPGELLRHLRSMTVHGARRSALVAFVPLRAAPAPPVGGDPRTTSP